MNEFIYKNFEGRLTYSLYQQKISEVAFCEDARDYYLLGLT